MQKYDAVLISTAHDSVNYKELANWADCIIDTRNAMAEIPAPAGDSELVSRTKPPSGVKNFTS